MAIRAWVHPPLLARSPLASEDSCGERVCHAHLPTLCPPLLAVCPAACCLAMLTAGASRVKIAQTRPSEVGRAPLVALFSPLFSSHPPCSDSRDRNSSCQTGHRRPASPHAGLGSGAFHFFSLPLKSLFYCSSLHSPLATCDPGSLGDARPRPHSFLSCRRHPC